MNPLVPFIDPSNYIHKAAAIVQPAVVKNCEWYTSKLSVLTHTITHSAKEYGETILEFKASGAWKSKFKSWPDCCREALKLSPRRVREIIQEITDSWEEESQGTTAVSADNSLTLPDNQGVTEQAQTDTATTNEPLPEPEKPPVIADEMGFPIPKSLLETHERRDKITKLMTAASTLKCFFDTQQEKPDPQFKGAFDGQVQTLMKTEGQIHFALSQCRPDVVCPSCDGKAKGCQDCRSTGFISSHDWQRKFVKSSASWIQAKVAKRQKAIEAL